MNPVTRSTQVLRTPLGEDSQLKERYSKTIKEYFEKRYFVQLYESESFRTDNRREWYLPHHPVIHPHKPGRVGRILIGAAKFHGYYLNYTLLIGPDLLKSLIHIVIRFRQYPNAVSADIEGMFLQVGVIPKDQPSLRFLWRGPINWSCCFSIHKAHLRLERLPDMRKLRPKECPNVAQSVQTNFYMDNYLESSPMAGEAIRKAKD